MPAEYTQKAEEADQEHAPAFTKESHPDLWPFDPFRVLSAEPAATYVARGCLAAPNVELAIFTGQPVAVQSDRRYPDHAAPSLTKRMLSFTFFRDRYRKYSYEAGPADEEYRMQAIITVPKTPAIRAAFLDTIRLLETNPETPDAVRAYLDARLVRSRVTTTQTSSGFSRESTFDATFHALHDTIGSGAPTADGWQGRTMSFYLRRPGKEKFAAPVMLKAYAERARAVAGLMSDDIRRIVLRDLSGIEPIISDFRTAKELLKREEKEWRLPPEEIPAKAWHTAVTSRSYDFSADSYDSRHGRLHWSAVILDYFVNLREIYARLDERHIPTSVPTIGPLIQAKRLMHVSRSLEAIEVPDRKPEPVDITIRPDRPVIFIGSNNSGKSFTMEMIAANVQESMQGRKTFAKKFESPEFDAIITIPAELPQETGKSTYTGQLGLLVAAITEVQQIRAVKQDARILLLTDELYAGTDENDSAALYKATIEWLSDNGVTLIGATNNELVFDPDIARFISMVNRKPVDVLKPEDIIAKRQGIPVLQTAGTPESVIRRAADLCAMDNLPASASETKPPEPFSDLRNAQTLGLLEVTYRKEIDVGKNMFLWDFLPMRNKLLHKAATLERVFGTDSEDPLKQMYRSWFDSMTDEFRIRFGEHLRRLPEVIDSYITMEHSFRNDSEQPEATLRTRDITTIESARAHREWLDETDRLIASAPDDMQAALKPALDALRAAVTILTEIPVTDETSFSSIHSGVINAVSPFWVRKLPFIESTDNVSAFFHLDRLFRHHHFCRTTATNGSGIETTGLFHTGLTYELERKNETVTKNDLKLDGSHPGILLGANASGKTTLAESLGVAAFFALNFGYAPAKTFALGAGIKKTAVLTDYLRDPGRPKDSGKWLSRQTQIAAILAAAKDGGYLVVLDEPGEGTNGFEGRATLVALAEYLHARGNTVIFTTHQHKAIDILDTTTGITAYASGRGGEGRYSFAPGRASSLGLEIALEEGLLPEIVDRAREILRTLTTESAADSI